MTPVIANVIPNSATPQAAPPPPGSGHSLVFSRTLDFLGHPSGPLAYIQTDSLARYDPNAVCKGLLTQAATSRIGKH